MSTKHRPFTARFNENGMCVRTKHAREIRMQELATAATAATLERLDSIMVERATLLEATAADPEMDSEQVRLTRVAAGRIKHSDTIARRRAAKLAK
jgi:hypothetical protein